MVLDLASDLTSPKNQQIKHFRKKKIYNQKKVKLNH